MTPREPSSEEQGRNGAGEAPTPADLRDRDLASIALRVRPSTCRIYAERLDFTPGTSGPGGPRGSTPAGSTPRVTAIEVR